MKKVFRLVVLSFSLILVTTFISPASSAISMLNKPCPKVKVTKVNNGVNLVCKSIAGKKVWKNAPKNGVKQLVKSVPLIVPEFSLKYDRSILTATLIVNQQEIKNENIDSAEVIIYAKVDGNYKRIGNTNWSASKIPGPGEYNVSLSFSIPVQYQGTEVAMEFRYLNAAGQGEKALKAITTPTPTPTPVTSALPTAEIGCSVNYLSPLPYASQRMAIINMVWEKDSAGYVSVVASIRNDNSMALRLVNYTFYFMHKGSIITTTSTLEGDHHFYIQDDAKFNSSDGISGSWKPGQVRTFRIQTNQMLECKSISVVSSGYTVKQGIGAS